MKINTITRTSPWIGYKQCPFPWANSAFFTLARFLGPYVAFPPSPFLFLDCSGTYFQVSLRSLPEINSFPEYQPDIMAIHCPQR